MMRGAFLPGLRKKKQKWGAQVQHNEGHYYAEDSPSTSRIRKSNFPDHRNIQFPKMTDNDRVSGDSRSNYYQAGRHNNSNGSYSERVQLRVYSKWIFETKRDIMSGLSPVFRENGRE